MGKAKLNIIINFSLYTNYEIISRATKEARASKRLKLELGTVSVIHFKIYCSNFTKTVTFHFSKFD
jgi:hypothetical protein